MSAEQVNQLLMQSCPIAYELLSEYGKKIYYIQNGILGQTSLARTKATRFNATLGEAMQHAQPLYMTSMHQYLKEFSPGDLYPYASPYGLTELREAWKSKMLKLNPSLRNRTISLPVVTTGLTHALSLVGEMYINPGDAVVIPQLHWENYTTIFGLKCQAKIYKYPLVDENNRFSPEGLKNTLDSISSQKVFLVLNYPHNPTGYMPTPEEVEQIQDILIEAAYSGKKILLLLDDAYYGFWYGDSCLKESLLGFMAAIHPSILTLHINGATKEEYSGGIRVGFITAATDSPAANEAIENKFAGSIRCNISSCSRPAQFFLLKCLKSKDYWQERSEKIAIMEKKGKKVLQVAFNPRYADVWQPYPFNSGYFICLKLLKCNAYLLHQYLIEDRQIGVIVLSENEIRIAFPTLDVEQIENLFEEIHAAAIYVAQQV